MPEVCCVNTFAELRVLFPEPSRNFQRTIIAGQSKSVLHEIKGTDLKINAQSGICNPF